MNLRNLKPKDAPLMLEWMHDDSVTRYMQTEFKTKTIDECIYFIEASVNSHDNLHLAIADSNDIYMGTVSLKNIDYKDKTAEFAITVRKSAMGHGFASFGMKEILKKGFTDLKLEAIYWYVSPANIRALRFYDKQNFKRISDPVFSSIPFDNKYIWYIELREHYAEY